MPKTKYQDAAMNYAKDYLDKLLDLEDYVGHKLDAHINDLVEKKIEQRLKKDLLQEAEPEKKEDNDEAPSS